MRVRADLPGVAFVQGFAPEIQREIDRDPARFAFVEELNAVRGELERRGVDVRRIEASTDLTSLTDGDPVDWFVFGDRNAMGRWIEGFGLSSSVAGSYPPALHEMLGRRCWFGTPDELARSPARSVGPGFCKPCVPIFVDGHKVQASIFGRVEELRSLPAEFQSESFMWSELVEWRSEYRCYVLDSQILGIEWSFLRVPRGWNPSDVERRTPEVRPTIGIVEKAIRRLDEAGESVAGYCLDFGLTARGDMVLVEMNDALALTNYGLEIGPYVDLHVSRWRQLAGAGRDGRRARSSPGIHGPQRHGSESGH